MLKEDIQQVEGRQRAKKKNKKIVSISLAL